MPMVRTPGELADPHEHFEGVWTCLWCGQINVFMWEDGDTIVGSSITMLCNYCGGGTFMEQNKLDLPKRPVGY